MIGAFALNQRGFESFTISNTVHHPRALSVKGMAEVSLMQCWVGCVVGNREGGPERD